MNTIVKFFLISTAALVSSCCKETGQREPSSVSSGVLERLTNNNSFYNKEVKSIFESDPLAKYQWHLNNTAQTNFAKYPGTSGMDINARKSIVQRITGEGVKIAVSDNGVEIKHEDLSDNILKDQSKNYSLSSTVSPGWFGDPTPKSKDHISAHGTQVAGIIAMTAGNEIGGRGVAPGAKIAGFKYIGALVQTSMTIDQTQGDFDIFNYSYGVNQCTFVKHNKALIKAYKEGTTNLRGGLGAIYVKVAGNDYKGQLRRCLPGVKAGSTTFYGNTNLEASNSFPYLIIVSATNASGKVTSYSTPGSNIWIAAPGGEIGGQRPAIMTSDLSGCKAGTSAENGSSRYSNAFEFGHPLNKDCNYTSKMTGTSAATPVVSGSIALLLEVNPNLSWRDVKHILASTADTIKVNAADLGQPNKALPKLRGHQYQQNWVENAAGYSFHNWFGFGSINVDKAIQMARSYKSNFGDLIGTFHPSKLSPNYDSGALALNIPDNSAEGVSHSIEVKHNLTIESVRIELTSDHKSPQEVGVELTSPSGTKSIILNVNSGIKANYMKQTIMGSNAFYGEKSRGKWTIKLIDGAKGNEGKLKNWKIGVYGHAPEDREDVTPPAPVARVFHDTFFDASRSTPPFTWKEITSEDVARYEYSIGSSPGASDIFGWNMAPGNRIVQLTFAKDRVRFRRGRDYYFNIRVIDHSENRSTVTSSKWTTSKSPIE